LPSTNGQWKQFSQSIENPQYIVETTRGKTLDEIVVCLEEVKLQIAGGAEKNYIAISKVKLDPEKIEEGFYSSKLMLYDIEPGQKVFKVPYVDNHSMTITCLTHY
jgi:hypothetical protein